MFQVLSALREMHMNNSDTAPVVTIDGPSGSGKGTISQLLARRLGYDFLDSGALYRLTALAAERQGVDMNDEVALTAVAAQLDVRFDTSAAQAEILLAGDRVTDAIRQEHVGMNASKVAACSPVREALLARQRAFRKAPGLVADGRDMGTAVFPDAGVKIFLTASAEERAQRRHNQLKEKGESVSLRALLEDIQARDDRDMNRATSPLVPADDALVLDSTKMSIDEVLAAVEQAVAAAEQK